MLTDNELINAVDSDPNATDRERELADRLNVADKKATELKTSMVEYLESDLPEEVIEDIVYNVMDGFEIPSYKVESIDVTISRYYLSCLEKLPQRMCSRDTLLRKI